MFREGFWNLDKVVLKASLLGSTLNSDIYIMPSSKLAICFNVGLPRPSL